MGSQQNRIDRLCDEIHAVSGLRVAVVDVNGGRPGCGWTKAIRLCVVQGGPGRHIEITPATLSGAETRRTLSALLAFAREMRRAHG